MSSIKTTHIDGDVSVGRNVAIGGKAEIAGSVSIGHNLKVDGWLEAPNIKGPNKGLFKSETELRETYPVPENGWWALVETDSSKSSEYLGQLYVAVGGAWVAQLDGDGNPLLKGTPSVECTYYAEAIATHPQQISTLEGRISSVEEVAGKIDRSVDIGEIGSFFTSDLPSVQSGANCGLWQVKSGKYIIGLLEVFVDGMYHCISQKLSTNCTVNADGTIDGSGHQHTVRQYYRMYNVRWAAQVLNDGVTPWPVGTWSAWTECDREA